LILLQKKANYLTYILKIIFILDFKLFYFWKILN